MAIIIVSWIVQKKKLLNILENGTNNANKKLIQSRVCVVIIGYIKNNNNNWQIKMIFKTANLKNAILSLTWNRWGGRERK